MRRAKKIAAIICTILNFLLDGVAVHYWVEVGSGKLSTLYAIWAIIAVGSIAIYIVAKDAINWKFYNKGNIYYGPHEE